MNGMSSLQGGWHVVAFGTTLRPGHDVLSASADGEQLVLWRSAGGQVQAWDDRCPHRSVRLSLGQVVGDRLSCAYHGWQFAAGSGRCLTVPALPGGPVPAVGPRVFPTHERGGLVWVRTGADDGTLPGLLPPTAGDAWRRELGIAADLARVRDALLQRGWTAPRAAADEPWRGPLGDAAGWAVLTNARPGLTMVFVGCDAAPGTPALRRAQAAARGLRTDAERAAEGALA